MQTDKKTIYMKYICISDWIFDWMPGSDLLDIFRGWGESKMKLFLNIVMLHIKLKGTTHDSNLIAII